MRFRRLRHATSRLLTSGTLACLTVFAHAADVSVDGVGWLRGLTLERVLQQSLELSRHDAWEPDMVEDAFFFLSEQMRNRGYLNPEITATLLDAEGKGLHEYQWGPELQLTERDKVPGAVAARFTITAGPLAYFQEVTFRGLTQLPPERARLFFYAEQGLIGSDSDRAFNESILGSGMRNLEAELQARGYRDAMITLVSDIPQNAAGPVSVELEVDEGPYYRLGQVVEVLTEGIDDPVAASLLQAPQSLDEPFNEARARDLATPLRNRFYTAGYPAVEIRVEPTFGDATDAGVPTQVRLVAVPGPRTRIAGVRLEGFTHTDADFVTENVTVQDGDWLNRLEVESSRDRLARLGVYTRVRHRLEPADPIDGTPAQTVVLSADEVKRQNLALLMGWGSYELLRVGFIYQYRNLWGRAHRTTFQALQTFKSSAARWQYAIPETRSFAFQTQASLYGTTRKEVSFDREEFGAEVGVFREIESWDSHYSVVYRLEQLRSTGIDRTKIVGDPDQISSSIAFEWSTDMRNSVLSPDRGLRWGASVELADPLWGAQERYQLFDANISWQTPISPSWRLRVGLDHTSLTSLFGESTALPFNQRIFAGGENSIRGYPEGEASPRATDGTYIGAESATLLSMEVQRRFYKNVHMVFFVDQLVQAEDIGDWPGSDYLATVGAGLRMLTPLGPLRFEYGHNLTKRDGDPDGAWHFSIGYPF